MKKASSFSVFCLLVTAGPVTAAPPTVSETAEATATTTGLTIVKGSFKALMDNDKGVQIYLDGESTGLGSYTGMSSVDIT